MAVEYLPYTWGIDIPLLPVRRHHKELEDAGSQAFDHPAS